MEMYQFVRIVCPNVTGYSNARANSLSIRNVRLIFYEYIFNLVFEMKCELTVEILQNYWAKII